MLGISCDMPVIGPRIRAASLCPNTNPPPGEGIKRTDPHPEEQAIVRAVPEIGGYVEALKQKSRKVVVLALRQLLRLVKEYPRGALVAAVEQAAHYGLYDLDGSVAKL